MQKRRVTQLTRNELTELKRAFMCETNRKFSLAEVERADELISDEKVFSHYKNSFFGDDDFFCNDTKTAEPKGA